MATLNTNTWIEDVFDCLTKIEGEIFSLDDVYQFETHLSKLHPNNRNVKAKIRQQLQFLRDDGKLEFVNDYGTYRKLF